ncbi:hypothetical protein J4E93_010989 [Alternaria ventricosa]|uniref:uncharacterized protein n=1 Tax=Alternaria ventricosa TaxID=1187951 RepID=UPI0020C2C186|nr:uncharacterized protein J4E93_010989 [Alternaria ventricosa]KAI4636764.1 hypothetical protein J4E93_010989 [Alternaria ventricosa]
MVHSSADLAMAAEQQQRITIAFLVVSWIFILLRIWTRTCIIRSFGWDDAVMLLAGLTFTLFCGSVWLVEASGGTSEITSADDLQKVTKWVIVRETGYLMAIMLVKISLAIFFSRIVVRRSHFIIIYVTVAANIVSSMSAFFYVIFRCGPNLEKYAVNEIIGRCQSRQVDYFFAYQQDVVFFLLPIPILWYANMDLRHKFSVGFILSLAALGCICSGIRFPYITGLTELEDFFWDVTNVSIWSTVECGTCIIVGCMATLRPLMKMGISRARDMTTRDGSRSGTMKSTRASPRTTNHSLSQLNLHATPQNNLLLAELGIQYTGIEKKASSSPKLESMYEAKTITRPNTAATPLPSDMGYTKRSSADPILSRTSSDATDLPLWKAPEEKKPRQPSRLSLSRALLHRCRPTSEDVNYAGPLSDPISPPPRYMDAGDAV